MFERLGYRSTLYLSALIVVVHCGFFLYFLAYSSSIANAVTFYVMGATAVFIGLWLLSKFGRYAGAAFYIFSAVAAALPFSSFKSTVMSIGVVWVVTMGLLSAATALILIFSKQFAKEFEAERETRPVYKKYLASAFTILIVLSAAAGAYIDIVSFLSN